MSIWSRSILSTPTESPDCSRLFVCTSSPLSCSLLMYWLSVQRRKACLSRWRVSKKGRQPIHCLTLPLLQFSQQNNRSLSPCSVCSQSTEPLPDVCHVKCWSFILCFLILVIKAVLQQIIWKISFCYPVDLFNEKMIIFKHLLENFC